MLFLLFEAWARNLQLVKEQPAKAGQGGEGMSLAKMKTRKEAVDTWRVELPLIKPWRVELPLIKPEGGRDFQEDGRPSQPVLEF
jgi:hypothetical protein